MSSPVDNHLLRELEQATADKDPSPTTSEPFDGETSTLRESWKSLAKLLKAADADFNEEALLEKLRPAILSSPAPHRRRYLTNWRLGIAAVTAASLLLAFAMGNLWLRNKEQLAHTSRQTHAPHSRESSASPVTLDTPAVYAWDDPLDERLNQFSEQLIYTAREWRGYDPAYSALDQHLHEMHNALADEPL